MAASIRITTHFRTPRTLDTQALKDHWPVRASQATATSRVVEGDRQRLEDERQLGLSVAVDLHRGAPYKQR